MQIFISHSSENAKEAEAVCGIIEKAGHKCFLAPRDIRSGHEYAEEIIDGIDNSSAVVLLLSEAANSSPHVLREIERAVSKKLSIIVYKLEDVNLSKSMEYFLMTHQWVNKKQDKGYKEILDCINGLSDKDDPQYEEQEQNTGVRSRGRGFIAKTIAAAAVLIVCIVASILIFGNSDKPESVMNENTFSESGEGAPETEGITESEVPSEAENTGQTSEPPVETSVAASSETLAETSSETLAETSSETSSETQTEAASEHVSENTEESVTQDTAETAAPAETESTAQVTEAQASETEAAAEPKAELGDSFKLGEYLGEPIKWRVIQLSEDGKTAVVIADNILTMKAFDAAECGKYNSYNGESYWNVPPQDMTKETERLVRGDNSWALSNLRTWLNSSRDNITYTDQEPNSRAMSELKNGYNTEAGFLKSFNKTEIKAVLTTQVTTNGAVTEDKVYLLSKDELYLLDEADVSTYAVPTESAVEQDQSGWYTLNIHEYRVRDHYWWLRDPNTDTASEVYLVNNSYAGDRVFSHNVGLEGYGVRPVMTVDLTADCIVIE